MKIAVLGAGQLAGMLAKAANKLNIELISIDGSGDSCIRSIANVTQIDYEDSDKLSNILSHADYVTYETENLPIAALTRIKEHIKIEPTVDALRLFQDRLLEKNFLTALGIPVVNYIDISSWLVLKKAVDTFSYPFIIKTRLNGYDGKGQTIINDIEELSVVWKDISATPTIAEQFFNFDYEVSIIAVRSRDEEIAFYPMTLNQHKNGILHSSQAPFINHELEIQARVYAKRIMDELNYVGVMTIEFFCKDNQLIVNEIAPRVHNSGHWTIEGAETSQFENHLRAIAGLPLGSTKPTGHSLMVNIIGQDLNNDRLNDLPNAHLHWYGKAIKPKRKCGHITLVASSDQQLNERALKLRELITINN